jgi:hypothetical protein
MLFEEGSIKSQQSPVARQKSIQALSGGDALISMVQAAEFSFLDNHAVLHHRPFDGTLLGKSQVSPG